MTFIAKVTQDFGSEIDFVSYYANGGSGSGFGFTLEQAKKFKTRAGAQRAIKFWSKFYPTTVKFELLEV